MSNPMANDDTPKQNKSRKATSSKRGAGRLPQHPAPEKPAMLRSSENVDSTRSITPVVITESEYRALVAQKAHELFRQRGALTEVDDWLQAERLVKEALLAQGQTAGLV